MEYKDKKTIMIIEDDIFIMDIYQTKLQKDGFDVMAAENGLAGLKKLESSKSIPNLILLDIAMPYMNGLEFLKKIKENKTLKDIPVIMLTNLSQKEEVKKGFDLGAKDYLIKSHFTPTEVMNKINKYL